MRRIGRLLATAEAPCSSPSVYVLVGRFCSTAGLVASRFERAEGKLEIVRESAGLSVSRERERSGAINESSGGTKSLVAIVSGVWFTSTSWPRGSGFYSLHGQEDCRRTRPSKYEFHAMLLDGFGPDRSRSC
jgi:hypothetical protein